MSERSRNNSPNEKDRIAESGYPCAQDTNPPLMPGDQTTAPTVIYRRTPPVEHDESRAEQESFPTSPVPDGHTVPVSNPIAIHPLRTSGQGNPIESPTDTEAEYLRLASSGTSSFLDLDLSNRSSSSLNSCSTCELLSQIMMCKESTQFWRELDRKGPEANKECHVKFFSVCLQRLKDCFPDEVGLKSKTTINLLHKMLNVDPKDPTAAVKLSDLKRATELFGPIMSQDKKCILVKQLHEIIKNSLKSRDRDKRVKSSWFVGEMSRETADTLLLAPECKDKTYLVRISHTDGGDGDFVLSVRHEDHCHHLKIKGDPKKALAEVPYKAHLKFAGKEFDSLVECVDYVAKKQRVEIDIKDEESGACALCKEVICLRVFSKSPLNAVMSGYERTK